MKFSSDRHFGSLKPYYANDTVECFSDFIECVRKSAPTGYNCVVSSVDPVTGERNIVWNYWTNFLELFFSTITIVRSPLPRWMLSCMPIL